MKWSMVVMLAIASMTHDPARAQEVAPVRAMPLSPSGHEYLALADQALRNGRLDQAGSMIQFLEREPGDAPADDITLLHAEYLVVTGQYDEGALALSKIQDLTRNPCRLQPLLGWKAGRDAQWAEAVGHFRNATSACPDDEGLWNRLALALAAAGDASESKNAFQQALNLAPDNVDILLNYGNMLLDNGELTDVSAVLQRAKTVAANDKRVIALSDIVLGSAGQSPERDTNDTDNQYARRLLTAVKGAEMTGQDALVQSLKARALLLLDRYDLGAMDMQLQEHAQ